MTQLALQMKPEMLIVDDRALEQRTTMTGALILCQETGGVTPQQLAGRIVKDEESWSRIKSGRQNFPQDRLEALMDQCRNEAPLFWLARRRGYACVPLETELQRQIRVEREAREKAEAENRLLRDLLMRAA